MACPFHDVMPTYKVELSNKYKGNTNKICWILGTCRRTCDFTSLGALMDDKVIDFSSGIISAFVLPMIFFDVTGGDKGPLLIIY